MAYNLWTYVWKKPNPVFLNLLVHVELSVNTLGSGPLQPVESAQYQFFTTPNPHPYDYKT